MFLCKICLCYGTVFFFFVCGTYRVDIQERKTLEKIKEKVTTNNTTIAKADEGHSLVIIPINVYYEKV